MTQVNDPEISGGGAVQFTFKELIFEIRNDLRQITQHVTDLERKGSDQAQLAIRELRELDSRITKLELMSASKEAVEDNTAALGKLAIAVIIAIMGMVGNIIITWLMRGPGR